MSRNKIINFLTMLLLIIVSIAIVVPACNLFIGKTAYSEIIFTMDKKLIVTYEGNVSSHKKIILEGFNYCLEQHLEEEEFMVIYYFNNVKYVATINVTDYKTAKTNKDILNKTRLTKAIHNITN